MEAGALLGQVRLRHTPDRLRLLARGSDRLASALRGRPGAHACRRCADPFASPHAALGARRAAPRRVAATGLARTCGRDDRRVSRRSCRSTCFRYRRCVEVAVIRLCADGERRGAPSRRARGPRPASGGPLVAAQPVRGIGACARAGRALQRAQVERLERAYGADRPAVRCHLCAPPIRGRGPRARCAALTHRAPRLPGWTGRSDRAAGG